MSQSMIRKLTQNPSFSRLSRLFRRGSAIPAMIGGLVLAGAGLSGDPVRANPYADHVTVRLLPGWVEAGGDYLAGLEIVLDQGWKTYWRAPGDAGVPPVFHWGASRNVAAVQVIWPRPQVFYQNGMRSIGYSERVVIPLRVTPGRADRKVRLDGKVQIGICSDICVPLDVSLDAVALPQTGTRVPAIAASMADRPYSGDEVGLRDIRCEISVGDRGVAVRAQVDIPPSGGREVVVFETGDPGIYVAEAKTSRQGRQLTAQTEMMRMDGKMFALDRSRIRVTILGEDQAVDITGCPAG